MAADMKTKFSCGLSALCFALLCGCESDRLKPSSASPGRALPLLNRNIDPSELEALEKIIAQPPAIIDHGARPLFDGKTLSGWSVTDFAAGGEVQVRDGLILMRRGEPFTGVNFTNDVPKVNYEVSFDAARISGYDFFATLTFPVRDSFCSLVLGGWGGTLVGLSSLDGADASENETTKFITFETGRWYHVRVRVTGQKIEAWIEQKKVVDATTSGRRVSLRFGDIERSKPLGFATYETTGAVREIRIRNVSGPASEGSGDASSP